VQELVALLIQLTAERVGQRRGLGGAAELVQAHRPDGDPGSRVALGAAGGLAREQLGVGLQDGGDRIDRAAEAASLADSLGRELDQERYQFLHQYADLAAYYAWRGDAERSVHWLERAVAHSPMLHRWQLESGLFDKVRRTPAFEAGFARARQLAEERLRARRAVIGQ
jgi:hypothetical protein